MKTKINALVNLNTNPCKMCMPMGAATAFYGIKDCITILHGSQGCATYIRRHMATHYNEPVDIASSSLTEQGTVYGGENNLKKGLKNLISLYNPKVIGVMTTCLAETIGEDVVGIIERFYEENPEHKNITILPVNSPGYGGTQYEGYFASLNTIAEKIEMDTEKNQKINVIIPPHSPADIRFLKAAFKQFGLDVILLPDISENLDSGHNEVYSRLPKGGTELSDLKKMGGARYTIEFADIDCEKSPAKTLYEKYGVPYKRLASPVGLKATDEFYKTLAELAVADIPQGIKEERSRYIDGMIDSHKYNSAGRAVIFGEPEFVVSAVSLCTENGILPVVVSTGSVFHHLKKYVEDKISYVAKKYYVEDYIITDDTDFAQIEAFAKKHQVNIMIGNSDGRRIEEELKIPLVRRAFPIHDRIGGQRLRMLGYEGSLSLLDEITNALLSVTENTFRDTLYDTYYKGTPIDESGEGTTETKDEGIPSDIMKKTMEHPCYNCAGHQFARIHLPVAPSCNVQCNYCVRKYDCPNESRPGVTSTILTPEEALARYIAVKERMPNLTVVGIAGPGDSLAGNYADTKKTLELIRSYDKDVTFCLSTNGLMLPFYAEELVQLGVTHVTVTMNAVDPKISGKIYKYINYMGNRFEGDAAGAIMVSNQLSGLKILLAHGVICKVNIVTLKGINESHIPAVVQTCKDMGCYITNIMQLIPVPGSAFESLPMVSNKDILNLRNECNKIMKQMFHCKQCRADAVGTLDNDMSVDLAGFLAPKEASPSTKSCTFAVASKSGVNVDLHFGHAEEFYIFEYTNSEVRFKERRNIEKYCNGNEFCDDKQDKIAKIIAALSDCDGVIAMRIGESPKVRLKDKGIKVISTFDKIENAVIEAAKAI
ncbi:FeMo cofactor biosynthesis protein NifB [Anaerotignum neopropionicum]|uniref:FeMo cofactor biosynthesis protein NifB n=1 Tax=Anaerotignum neopropionicum TaxID=36847 RepID=A0A136WFJ4_9FIRM|nr:nitrogenase component 1 [Anaerotignum neopropionicum]KXL53129.1 FeMo cofactor biosynthesis protein NifB [Anaerotignum neopropionicum]